MRVLELPPEEKVLEALSCVADDRIFVSGNRAKVLSSKGDREYEVELFPEENRVRSTDPATRWQHYYGYPVIAFMMLRGELEFDQELAGAMKGIPWRDWNEKNKKAHGKEYHKASFKQALRLAEEKGVSRERVKEFVGRVMKQLEEKGMKA